MARSARIALMVLVGATCGFSISSCGFKPVLKSPSYDLGPRKIWLSLFNAMGHDNPNCALGETGMMMASLIVDETGPSCMTSDLLGIYGLGYYRLELSPDGKVVKRFNAGCTDDQCLNCEYARTELSMGYCMSTPSSTKHVFSVAFAPAADDSCVGPYQMTNQSGVSAIAELSSSSDLCANGHDSANCTAVVFALTVTDNDHDKCHVGKIFPNSKPFSYTLSSSSATGNESFTMTFCNSTQCNTGQDTVCEDVLHSTPVNECVHATFQDMPATTVLRRNSDVSACQHDKSPFPAWIAIAAGAGVVALIIGSVGVAKMYRSRQRRDYSPLN